MYNDFEIIIFLRDNHDAQAISFKIIIYFFRKIDCGFSSANRYSQDVDANGKQMGFLAVWILLH
jgi:hypothetical protein